MSIHVSIPKYHCKYYMEMHKFSGNQTEMQLALMYTPFYGDIELHTWRVIDAIEIPSSIQTLFSSQLAMPSLQSSYIVQVYQYYILGGGDNFCHSPPPPPPFSMDIH